MIARGFINITMHLGGEEEYFYESLTTGAMLGEVSCVTGARIGYTSVCRNYCKLALLTKEKYDLLCLRYPKLSEKMESENLKPFAETNPLCSFWLTHY